jgi:hypothetical protein
MAIKRTAFRSLATSGDNSRETEGGALDSELRVPTIEERALIFLRATKEKDDFSHDEYVEARAKILDAMGANITGPSALTEFRGPNTAPPDLEDLLKQLSSPEIPEMSMRLMALDTLADREPPAGVERVMASSRAEMPQARIELPLRFEPPKRKYATIRLVCRRAFTLIVIGLSLLGGLTLVRMAIEFLRVLRTGP